MDKKITDAVGRFIEAVESNPTSEAPLNALIDIEQKIIEIYDIQDDIQKRVDDVLKQYVSKTIDDYLEFLQKWVDSVITSAPKGSGTLIYKYLERLKIFYESIDDVILEPMDQEIMLRDGSKEIEKKELSVNKLEILLRILRDLGIYTDDLCIIIGENRPEMMRDGSYFYIEIPKINRSILLHMRYGEATFVLPGIFERNSVFNRTKEEIVEDFGAIKIIFSESDISQWEMDIRATLDLPIGAKYKKLDVKEHDLKQKFISEIIKFYPTAEIFMKTFKEMTKSEKDHIRIKGLTLRRVSRIICGKSKIYPERTVKELATFAQAVYGKGHEIIDCESWSAEDWIAKIKRVFPTAKLFMEKFLNCKKEERNNFKLLDRGFVKLSTIITSVPGFKPNINNIHLAFLAQHIYGDGYEVIDNLLESEVEGRYPEYWRPLFKAEYPTINDFINFFGEMELRERSKYIFHGFTLKQICYLGFRRSDINPSNSRKELIKFAELIFQTEYEHKDITDSWGPKEWKKAIKEKYPTVEEFMKEFLNTPYSERVEIEIYGKNLRVISTVIFGVAKKFASFIPRELALLAAEVYGRDAEILEQYLALDESKDWDINMWRKKIKEIYLTIEEFVEEIIKIPSTQRSKFRLYGRSLNQIGTILIGPECNPSESISKVAVFAEFLYETSCDLTKELKKENEGESWDKEKWIYEIKLLYPTPESFINTILSLKPKKREHFKLHGLSLYRIATIIYDETGHAIASIKKELALFAKIVYGEGHEIIEDMLKDKESEKWSREEWIRRIKEMYPTPEEFMSLPQRLRTRFSIHEKGLIGISSILCGDKSLNPISLRSDLAILAKEIYGEGHEVIECEFWDSEGWKQAILRLYPTPESFMNMNRKEFKIYGRSLGRITFLITGIKNTDPQNKIEDFATLARSIYGENHNMIESRFWDREKWREVILMLFPTPETFMSLVQKERAEVKLYGFGLRALSSIFVPDKNLKPVGIMRDHALMAQAIYGEGHEVIEIHLKEEKELDADNWKKIIIDRFPTIENFVDFFTNLERIPRRNYLINGKDLNKIATIIHGNHGHVPTDSKRQLILLAYAIYDKEYEIHERESWGPEEWKEAIRKRFTTPEEFIETISNLSARNRKIFEIEGKRLNNIATIIFGNSRKFRNASVRALVDLGIIVFGEGYEIFNHYLRYYESEEWDRETWIEKIKEKYRTLDIFMSEVGSIGCKTRKDIKIFGKTLNSIATIIFNNASYNPGNSKTHLALLAKEIYEETNDEIESMLKEREKDTWDREKWIMEIKILYPEPKLFMDEMLKSGIKGLKGAKIHGKSLISISTAIFGGFRKYDPMVKSGLAQLARTIYGEGHEVIERHLEEDECDSWSVQQWVSAVKEEISDPKKIMALTHKQRNEFKIHGRGLDALATLILQRGGVKVTGSIKNLAILARGIYGEGHDIIECEFWDNENWKEAVRKSYPDPGLFLKIWDERKSFEFLGRKLNELGRMIFSKPGYKPFNRNGDFLLLTKEIYGEGHELIDIQLWNAEKWIEVLKENHPTPEEFMSIPRPKRDKLRFFGVSLRIISSILLPSENLKPGNSNNDYAKLAKAIYGKGYDVIESHFWGKQEWIEYLKKLYPTPEEFMSNEVRKNRELRFFGKGLRLISSIIVSDGDLRPVNRSRDAAVLAQVIYGEGHEVIEKYL